MALYCMIFDLISIEIGFLGHFMLETVAQVATVCCVEENCLVSCLSRLLVLPSPALTKFSILELPRSGMYWTS